MSRWLYLPIEVKSREFESKVLLACFAACEGFNIVVGRKGTVNDLLKIMPHGVYIAKGIPRSGLNAMKARKKMGHKYTVLDEEAGISRIKYDEFLKIRTSPDTMKELDAYFAWGKNNADSLKKLYPGMTHKIFVTGGPRVDLWRKELRGYYKEGVEEIRNKYGRYILVASNFTSNHPEGLEFLVRLWREIGIIASDEEEKYFRDMYNYKDQLFQKFVEAIPEILKAFPEQLIIVRPHPVEDLTVWKNRFKGLERVKVVREGSVTKWIIGADLIIQNGCTTGVEATVMGKPVISYRPIRNEKYDDGLPNMLGAVASNVESLVSLIYRVLHGEPLCEDNGKKILEYNISSLDGDYAAEVIVKCIKDMVDDNTKAWSKYNPSYASYIVMAKVKHYFKMIMSKYPNLSGLLVSKTKLSSICGQDMGAQKCPPIELMEVEEIRKRLSFIFKEFSGLQVSELTPSVFQFKM